MSRTNAQPIPYTDKGRDNFNRIFRRDNEPQLPQEVPQDHKPTPNEKEKEEAEK